jgi:SAM-dependent methyltransferase
MADETKDKLFSRTEYRRVIAWPERIQREAPFFADVFEGAEPRRVLDVGCGTGEHARHFAEQGWQAVGIDVSENMIDDARELAGSTDGGGSARYEKLQEQMRDLLTGVSGALAPGARLLVQLLNYERILGTSMRILPVNFRPLPEDEGEGEIVFLRVMTPRADGALDFYPITLTLRPGDEDAPVELRSAKKGKHTAWTWERLEPLFAAAGFHDVRVLGGMSETPFSALESPDLVLIATKG